MINIRNTTAWYCAQFPPEQGNYLVYDGSVIAIGFFDGKAWDAPEWTSNGYGQIGSLELDEISHWAHLPEPPY